MKIQYKTSDLFNLAGHTILGIDLINWFKLHWKHRRHFDFRYLLKILVLTGPIAFAMPFRRLEMIIYRKRIKRTVVLPPIFILGHYRSGTTHLHNILTSDPQMATCTTNQALFPWTFLTLGAITSALLRGVLPKTRPMDNVELAIDGAQEEEFGMGSIGMQSYVHGFYFPKAIEVIFNESVRFSKNEKHRKSWQKNYLFFIKKLQFVAKGKRLILKSPGNTARIKEILEIFPDAKFIHIHRNPIEVYSSTLRLFEKVLPLLSFHRADEAELEPFIVSSYQAIYQKYFDEIRDLNSNQLIEISFDEFKSNPSSILSTIYNTLEIPQFDQARYSFEQALDRSSQHAPNSYEELDEETKKRIRQEWRLVFDRYGYTAS